MNWHQRSRQEGFRIKHMRNHNGRLVATVVHDEIPKNGQNLDLSKEIAYGITLVSARDNPCYQTGRSIAYQRYKKAQATRTNGPEIVDMPMFGIVPASKLWTYLIERGEEFLFRNIR